MFITAILYGLGEKGLHLERSEIPLNSVRTRLIRNKKGDLEPSGLVSAWACIFFAIYSLLACNAL